MTIPELELELSSGTLGSRFTTIEGLLDQIHDEIKANPFLTGDSSRNRHAFDTFLERLKKVRERDERNSREGAPSGSRPAPVGPLQQLSKGEIFGTFILNDPLGLSYLQNLYAPDPDPNMTITEYERSWEDNEEYGLNDINTDHYRAGGDGGDDADEAHTDTGHADADHADTAHDTVETAHDTVETAAGPASSS